MSESRGIERRDFLRCVGVGAGAAAICVAHGNGIASQAIADESGSADAKSADVSISATLPKNLEYENTAMSVFPESQPIAPVEVPEKWDAEYDVVVVGSGAGGLAAAMKLAEAGKTVCVIEKQSWAGGNSSYSSYFKCFGGTKAHEEAGFGDYATYLEKTVPAVMAAMYDGYLEEGSSRSFDELILRDEPKAFDWLIDEGAELDIDVNFSTGNDSGSGQGDGSKLKWKDDSITTSACRNSITLGFMADKASELGAEIILSTEAKALVVDGSKVVGVLVEGDGGQAYLKGNQGVILAAGGCLDNRDMLSVFSPAVARAAGCSMTNGSDTGDCIRMGMGLGAATCGRDAFIGNDAGPAWEIHGSWNVNLYGGWTQVGGQPWLTIDRYGELLAYYSTDTLGEIANFEQARSEMGRQGYRSYKILDSKYKDYVPDFGQLTWRIPLTKEMIATAPDFPGLVDWETGMEDGIASGAVPSADTLDELAQKLGITPDALKKGVDEWNAKCEAGEGIPDLSFPAEWMHPIDTPPYYGFALAAYACTTGFGLRVNNDLQVISGETDAPIEGLYAAYHTAGGWGEDTWMMASIINQAALTLWSGWRAANVILGTAED